MSQVDCERHGKQKAFVLGDKNYCEICVQKVLDARMKDYVLEP